LHKSVNTRIFCNVSCASSNQPNKHEITVERLRSPIPKYAPPALYRPQRTDYKVVF
jgi:hypothetical protein